MPRHSYNAHTASPSPAYVESSNSLVAHSCFSSLQILVLPCPFDSKKCPRASMSRTTHKLLWPDPCPVVLTSFARKVKSTLP